uniref:hypothetical protein n=1 Tax=Alloprevotella sp. TaxID=1872471 RepID=UPI00402A56D6
MKKIYLKPETNVIEYKLEGVVAMSGPSIREDKTVLEDRESYSNKQGWNSSLWSE